MESMQNAATSKAITWDGHTHFLAIILVHVYEKWPFCLNENQRDFVLTQPYDCNKKESFEDQKSRKNKPAKDQSSNSDGDTLIMTLT